MTQLIDERPWRQLSCLSIETLALQLSGNHFFICAAVKENVRGILSFNCRVKPKATPKDRIQNCSISTCVHHSLVACNCQTALSSRILHPVILHSKLLPRRNICGPTQMAVGPHKVEVQACVTPICAEMVSACVTTWLFQSISCMSSCLMQPARTAIRSISVVGCSQSPG